jgi:anti-sigma regulatory factor (Ser/Thr protein kinase)
MSAQPTSRGDPGSFRLRLRATPAALGIFRDALRDWLKRLEFENGDVFDVVLACSESLTLVIEDRPRQVALVVEVVGAFDGDRIVVTTRDYGLWHESHALEQDEPLGLSLMRALMDSVHVERHPDGQTITMSRRARKPESGHRALLI